MRKTTIKKANTGVVVGTFQQLDILVAKKKSVIWAGRRIPASVMVNQQYKIVRDAIRKGLLNVYIKNK